MISKKPAPATPSWINPTRIRPPIIVPRPGVASKLIAARAMADFRSSVLFFAPKKVFIHERQRPDAEGERDQQQKLLDEDPRNVAAPDTFPFFERALDRGLVNHTGGLRVSDDAHQFLNERH